MKTILQAEMVKDENGNQLTYPNDKCRYIVDAMSQFGLCYCLPSGSHFVIPDKLPEQQPDLTDYFDNKSERTLTIEFDFAGLLPRSIMPNLIVARHQDIVSSKQSKQLVWQRGVIIRHQEYESTARIQVNYQRRILQLWVQGKQPREYLVILRDEIYGILNTIKGLSKSEMVILPDFARVNQDSLRLNTKETEKITYQRLIVEAKAGDKFVTSDAGNQYDLKKVMGFIMTKEQQQKEQMNITVHGNVGAIGGTGENQRFSGKVILNSADKQAVSELQQSLGDLMQYVENHDAEFAIKSAAYAELKQIRESLNDLDNATPETKSKLSQSLASIKDGSLGALKLVKGIKEADDLVVWLAEKAVLVSPLIAALSG